jgi:serine/threonine protein kinase
MTKYTQGQFNVSFIRRIGAGGIGSVDEVEVVRSSGDPPVGTRFARKQLGPQWAQDPAMRERFEREIVLLATMNHPNIVSLAGVSASATERFYVMPLYANSLRDTIAGAPRARSPIEVAGFGALLADALAYAHGMGFVHRDLKPENILLRGREVVIADWGIGRFIHKQSRVLDLTVGGLGTSYYCSMEQWSPAPDLKDDPRMDIYSLGVLLAELAFGEKMPILPIGAGIRVNVVDPSTRAGQTFNAVITKMTGATASMRYPSMAHVAEALRSVG